MSKIFLFLILLTSTASAQKADLQYADTKITASFRGLSVINDSIAWVSGSNGQVGITLNGGKDWSFRQVKGFEKCDLRSLYAFNAKDAVIANAGSPAYILRTSDGGLTWQKVYENNDTAAFIDGICFWDHKNGAVYGDPVNGHMMLLTTKDNGKTWKERSSKECPAMSPGEASFAASGTCIKCMERRKLIIATGGTVSRLLVSKNRGKSWKALTTPILQGSASTGIFTFLPLGKSFWVIAGGDYKRDSLSTANLFYTHNAGKKWFAPAHTTRGYRECIEVIKHTDVLKGQSIAHSAFWTAENVNTLLAAGPGGIDISYDSGNKWRPLSDEKQFHVVKKSRNGNLIIAAGGAGKVAVVKISE